MKPIVYFAHPRPDRSGVNSRMFQGAQDIEGITCVDLYAEYPTFNIDIDQEQQRLLDHDVVIMPHPLYWYSSPAILKEWQDLVLEHGFAYGHDGHALDGKIALNAVTCGAPAEAYSPSGANGANLRTLLAPFEKTFDLCRMQYLAPFALFGAGRSAEEGRDREHISNYLKMLTAFRDDLIDPSSAASLETINEIELIKSARSEIG